MGRDPAPVPSTSNPHDLSQCYPPVPCLVYKVDVLQEDSPPKFCMHSQAPPSYPQPLKCDRLQEEVLEGVRKDKGYSAFIYLQATLD
jgi:hypothetical protein